MCKLKRKLGGFRCFSVHWLIVIAFLILSQSNLLAQSTSGGLKGKIIDVTSEEALPFANVIIDGTAIGAASDREGNYRISNIPVGSYDMIITFIGYTKLTIPIQIVADRMLEQDVELNYNAVGMGEIIITAQAAGQVKAINRQLNANSVMNVVSSDRIQELPDANVAEAIGRIPGVSVTREAGEASKIVIRGLEPKLNAITVNGVKIPATSSGSQSQGGKHAVSGDQGDRAVDLSMMSAELLEAIEVYKAPLPDMSAEAIGGIVNLRVKKAPEERSMLLKTNGGFNQLNSDYSDYKVVGQYSQRFIDNKLGMIGGVNFERFNRGSERFNATYDTDGVVDTLTGIVPIAGQRMNIRKTEEIRKRFGGYLTLDYAYDDGVIWLTNFYSQTSRNPFSVTKAYEPRGETSIGYDVRYQEIDISGLSSSLNGEHQLLGMDVDWVVSRYGTQTNNDYDMEMEFRAVGNYDENILDRNDIDTYVPAANDSLNSVFLRNNHFMPDSTSQTDYSAELNLQLPFAFGKKLGGFFKFGGKLLQTDRERLASQTGIVDYYLSNTSVDNAVARHSGSLELDENGRITGRNFVKSETDVERIVNDEYRFHPLFDRNKLTEWYDSQNELFVNEAWAASDEYDLKETVSAGYVMAKLNYGQLLSVIPGVRYEHSDNEYNAVWSSVAGTYGGGGSLKDTASAVNYDHWFPHLHIKFKPLSWFDLRLSAIKTIARPNYYWVAPWTRLNVGSSRIDRGNPDLKESISWNYDLATSFYSSEIGLFTIGGFYKELKDIFFQKTSYIYDPEEIELLRIPGGNPGYNMRTYANADEASVWGFEIDLQMNLSLVPFVPRFLNGIVLNANYARIWSETYYPQFANDVITDYSTWPPTVVSDYKEWKRKGPMPGQAEQIFNISLGYDIGGLSARISVLYQGASKSSIGVIEEEDRWNDDFWRWDSSVKYKLNNLISFNLSLSHITGQPDRTFFGESNFQTNRYYYGMTGNLGIQLNY